MSRGYKATPQYQRYLNLGERLPDALVPELKYNAYLDYVNGQVPEWTPRKPARRGATPPEAIPIPDLAPPTAASIAAAAAATARADALVAAATAQAATTATLEDTMRQNTAGYPSSDTSMDSESPVPSTSVSMASSPTASRHDDSDDDVSLPSISGLVEEADHRSASSDMEDDEMFDMEEVGLEDLPGASPNDAPFATEPPRHENGKFKIAEMRRMAGLDNGFGCRHCAAIDRQCPPTIPDRSCDIWELFYTCVYTNE
ncbi:hypothetical protein MAC_07057 [Metarhizium acridum CQMa 102]|uniref:Uncharacterized protein n=1 Tax=Metarhizium acridum (strain CQMa 102) TaxID=655827 RepID=E9EB09_METAQ|nr:uncharacterized protein MAC_07057 [Metarhizium acridum CQMa 102]EFY86940.1 hypothetical protein MAC_07057 [Metarhizium acridum CQMa 102]